MAFLKKHKLEFFVLAVLTLIYCTSRFYSILSLPIFTDEAIYIRWAQIAKQDASWRFISLTDGKQPMFIWLMMISLRLIADPLLAGRVVSVGAGFMTLIGMYFLGKEIFKSNKIGLISSCLYVIFPMALVYDRMALYDSLVGAFAVWSLFLIIQFARKVRLDIALILGMIAGGGVLTKTSGFFSIYLLPLSLILFNWSKEQIRNRLIKWLSLFFIAVAITYGFYSILRLSPFFHIINEKNTIFVYPLREWFAHPFDFFIGNWRAFWDWVIRYMILFLLPLIAFSLANIEIRIKKISLFVIFCVLVFLLSIKTDYLILTDFDKAYIPQSDIDQYSKGWPAGQGVREYVNFFENEAKKGKIYIATQGTFGLMPFALEIYLINNPNIKIEGYWPVGDVIPTKVTEESKKNPTYFLFYQPCSSCAYTGAAPVQWNLNSILQVKGGQNNYTSIYRIK